VTGVQTCALPILETILPLLVGLHIVSSERVGNFGFREYQETTRFA
jgi:hypothetical protein